MEITNAKVYNFDGAIRGARNPLNSWANSDSDYIFNLDAADVPVKFLNYEYIIGEKDLNLLQRLIKADTNGEGNPNSKFLRQIFVSCDISAPLYWWKEMDTYKVSTVANSTSTMHTLSKESIDDDCFEFMDFTNIILDNKKEVAQAWVPDCTLYQVWADLINVLEILRERAANGDKAAWRELVRILPSAWIQKRTWTGNYSTLRSIYFWRKSHKLVEWHVFCDWIRSLPYTEELIMYGID